MRTVALDPDGSYCALNAGRSIQPLVHGGGIAGSGDDFGLDDLALFPRHPSRERDLFEKPPGASCRVYAKGTTGKNDWS